MRKNREILIFLNVIYCKGNFRDVPGEIQGIKADQPWELNQAAVYAMTEEINVERWIFALVGGFYFEK
jgi:hypothetical protein